MDEKIVNLLMAAEKIVQMHKAILERNNGVTKLSDEGMQLFNNLEDAVREVKSLTN